MIVYKVVKRQDSKVEVQADPALKCPDLIRQSQKGDVCSSCKNQPIRPQTFTVGTLVCMLVLEGTNTLCPKWEEGYFVKQILPNDNYLIQDTDKTKKPFILPATRLKKFLERQTVRMFSLRSLQKEDYSPLGKELVNGSQDYNEIVQDISLHDESLYYQQEKLQETFEKHAELFTTISGDTNRHHSPVVEIDLLFVY